MSGLIWSEVRLVLVGIRHETAPAYATHHVARRPKMLPPPNLRQSLLDRQARDGWGGKVVERLVTDLRAEFPEMRGLSRANLLYMRAFAEA